MRGIPMHACKADSHPKHVDLRRVHDVGEAPAQRRRCRKHANIKNNLNMAEGGGAHCRDAETDPSTQKKATSIFLKKKKTPERTTLATVQETSPCFEPRQKLKKNATPRWDSLNRQAAPKCRKKVVRSKKCFRWARLKADSRGGSSRPGPTSSIEQKQGLNFELSRFRCPCWHGVSLWATHLKKGDSSETMQHPTFNQRETMTLTTPQFGSHDLDGPTTKAHLAKPQRLTASSRRAHTRATKTTCARVVREVLKVCNGSRNHAWDDH